MTVGADNTAGNERASIKPTYDHRETGDRYTVETRVDGRPLPPVPCRDPFVFHRVTVGWRDLLRAVVRRRLVIEVIVGGDHAIIEDVLELDADYLGTQRSSRRKAWNAQLNDALAQIGEPRP